MSVSRIHINRLSNWGGFVLGIVDMTMGALVLTTLLWLTSRGF